MASFAFLFGVFLVGGTMGIPMGMPPGPEDPMMAQIAPDECLFYASWSGVAKTDPDANPTEKWMAQPKASLALVKLRKAYRGFLELRVEERGATSRLTNDLLVEIVDAGSVNAAALYVDKLEIENGSFSFEAASMVAMGEHKDVIKKKFDEIHAFLTTKAKFRKSKSEFFTSRALIVDGEKTIEIASSVESMPILVTLRDDYVVMGVGNQAIARLTANSKTPTPKWLAEMKGRLNVDRIASVGFADLEKIDGIFRLPIWDFWVGQSIEDLVQDTKQIGWVSGLDEKGFLSRSEFITPAETTGILSTIDLAPIPENYLTRIPADTTIGIATRLSSTEILRLAKETAGTAGQEEAIAESLKEFQKFTGVSLEKELLSAVGDFVYAYYRLDIQNFQTGWVISVRIEDEMSFPAIFANLNRGLKESVEASDDAEFIEEKHGLQDIYSVKNNRFAWRSFAWAVVDDQWYFARNPDEIKTHLSDQPKENQFLNQAAVKAMFSHGDKHGLGAPVMIFHLNLADVFEALRPFAFILNSDNPINEEFDFNWNDIPPIDELVNEVTPNYLAVYRTKIGFQMLQRQTYPGSSPPVTVAALAVGTLPTQLSEMAGRQNMRLLGEAHLEFEKKHKHLCAAYSADANGNHLLSWRVHLLPFLGQEELYNKFRLDEPWDSAHNFSLVEEMPEVYEHPILKLDANKTVFLVSTRDDAAFGDPIDATASPPLGRKLSDITDGVEDTIMLLELNDDNQTFWTKPQDTQANGAQLQIKTKRIRDSNRFYVVSLSGEVHSLGTWTPVETLNRLTQRNDGKEAKLPRTSFFR